MRTFVLGLSIPTLLSVTALAAEPAKHPYSHWTGQVRTIDYSEMQGRRPAPEQLDFAALDEVARGERPADPDGQSPRTGLPDGWVQRGGMVLPAEIADGTVAIEPESIFAVEDIPGNEYPRKHTLYLNFVGGMLESGTDNSALSKSSLARTGVYPAFAGGEAKAVVSVVQGVEADFAPFGVRVVYLERPGPVVPYTMAMVSGDWTDTNIESPAGGVAPGADCGALGQRHVVYAFESSSAVQMANTTSQEAGHAYGLDHTFNCSSVMSYCGSGDQSFQSGCDGLCEAQCQGANSAGCRLTHEMFCGEGNDQQDDVAEMAWIFGGNEPDMEAPTADVLEPADGATFDAPADVQLRATVDDNYGGYAWKFVVEKDGEVIVDEVDYERNVDAEYNAALNLTGLPAGSYVFRIEVYDHYEGVGVDEVSFQVGPGAATSADAGTDDGTGDATADDDGTSGDDSNDDDDTDATDGGDAEAGFDDDGGGEKACNCTSGSSPSAAWSGVILLFALVGLRRRGAASTEKA